MDNAIILFSVKDKDLFGYSNQYIAECYVLFSDIPDITEIETLEQTHLNLTRPTFNLGNHDEMI